MLPTKFKLRMTVATFFGDNASLPFKLIIGGQQKQVVFGDSKTVEVPFVLKTARENKIVIKVPKPITPRSVDSMSGDTRELGMLLSSITLEPV